MIVMGSGAVGVEFASVYARFGCETTVVELMDRIVPIEDADVSKQLERSFKKQKITCLTGVKLDKLTKTKTSVKVSGKDSKGKEVTLEAEMLLVAVGRMPFLENLGLENTKVKVTERGVVDVNEFCETAEPNVFAIGDVINTAMARSSRVKRRHHGCRKACRQEGRGDQHESGSELYLLRP